MRRREVRFQHIAATACIASSWGPAFPAIHCSSRPSDLRLLIFAVQAGLPVELGVNYAALRVMKENGAITEAEAEALEGGAVVPRPIPLR